MVAGLGDRCMTERSPTRWRGPGEREGEHEHAPQAAGRLEPQPAVMLFGDPPADVEPKARTSDLPRARATEERSEQLVALVVWDPDPAVGHADLRLRSQHRERHVDGR